MAAIYQFRLNVQGLGTSQAFSVPVGIAFIGRQVGYNLVLEHPQVSRKHVQLATTLTECEITDLNSSNGTYVNSKKLQPNVPLVLQPGDIIQIGPFTLVLERILVDEAAPPTPVAPSRLPLTQAPVEEEAELEALSEKFTSGSDGKEPGTQIMEMVPTGLSIHSQQLISYLPGIYQTDFMSRFLGLFESILVPIEWNIDNFDLFLDPATSPAGFLPWLANWFGIILQPNWTDKQRRTFLKNASAFYAHRGTRSSMKTILSIFAEKEIEIDDTAKDLPPFTFRVILPMRKEEVNLPHLYAIIDANKPAYTSYILVFKE